jgi:hypothetical protein
MSCTRPNFRLNLCVFNPTKLPALSVYRLLNASQEAHWSSGFEQALEAEYQVILREIRWIPESSQSYKTRVISILKHAHGSTRATRIR